jgi:hypothetical protein
MSKMMKLVAVAALSFAATTSVGAAAYFDCQSYCEYWAKQEQGRYCARSGGGSACATSQGVYQHFLNQCKQGMCK